MSTEFHQFHPAQKELLKEALKQMRSASTSKEVVMASVAVAIQCAKALGKIMETPEQQNFVATLMDIATQNPVVRQVLRKHARGFKITPPRILYGITDLGDEETASDIKQDERSLAAQHTWDAAVCIAEQQGLNVPVNIPVGLFGD